jgi:transposase
LSSLGHEVKLIAPEAVKPFVKKGRKNDAADAAALCVAGSRPETRFVPIKTVEQQAVLALHAARSLLVKQRTMLANALRGLAAELGLIAPKGLPKLEELMTLVSADESIPAAGRQAMAELHAHGRAVAERLAALEDQIVRHARQDATARRLATIPGIGPITASLLAATVGGNVGVFPSARSLPPGSAWCRGSARPAARRAWGGSPRRATPRSAGCWCSAPPRWFGAPRAGTARPVGGCKACWRGARCGWSRWRWRTRWRASRGR